MRQRSPAKGHRTGHYAINAPFGSNRNSHKRVYMGGDHIVLLHLQSCCGKVNVDGLKSKVLVIFS